MNPEIKYLIRHLLHRLYLRDDVLVRVLDQIKAAVAVNWGVLESLQREQFKGQGPVLIWSVIGGLLPNVVECLLGYALRLRGMPVHFFICDKVLPACEGKTIRLFPRFSLSPRGDRQICNQCFFLSSRVLDNFGLPYTVLSKWISEDMVQHAEGMVHRLSWEEVFDLRYKGTHLGPIIHSSVIRFFLRVDLADDSQTQEMVRRYGVAAILLVDLCERLLDELKPRAIVTSHGVYITWGIITEMAKQRGVPFTVWDPAYRQSTIMLSQGSSLFQNMLAEPTSLWETLHLTIQQKTQLKEYMDSRWRDHGQDRLTIYKSEEYSSEALWQQLHLDPRKPTLGLFPNVGWDAQVQHRNIAFPSIFEWIGQTVEFFAERPQWQLVIRSHPVETWFPQTLIQSVSSDVERRFPALPDNVRVIPANSPISSYGLAKIIRAGAVHGTQFGLELAYMGLPVIVTGGVYYRGKGFTYDVSTPDEYFALLDQFHSLPTLTHVQRERAEKYAYHVYFRRQIPFPYIEYAGKVGLGNVRLKSLADLLPGKDTALDLIIRNILEGKSFVVDL